MSEGQRLYTQEEVEGILRLASQANVTSGVTRDQLVQIAGEVGLTSDQVAAAERQFAAQRIQTEGQQRDVQLRAEFRSRLRSRLTRKIVGAFAALLMLIVIFGHMPGNGPPSIVPIIFSVVVGIQIVKRLVPLLSKDVYEERYQAWKAGRGEAGEEDSFRVTVEDRRFHSGL